MGSMQWTSLDALAVLLYRFASGTTFGAMESRAGLFASEFSSVFNFVLTFLHNKYSHSTRCHSVFIHDQHVRLGSGYDPHRIALIVDGTLIETARPYWGQECLHNGHKKRHGHNNIVGVAPDGIITSCFDVVFCLHDDKLTCIIEATSAFLVERVCKASAYAPDWCAPFMNS